MIRLSVKTISLGLTLVAAFAFIGVDHASADLINQSPIDIITNDVVRQLHFKTIDFNYSNDTTLTVKQEHQLSER